MRMKKLVSLLLALVMIVSTLPLSLIFVSAAQTPQADYDVKYYVSAQGRSTNSGTADAPLNSIAAAYNKLVANPPEEGQTAAIMVIGTIDNGNTAQQFTGLSRGAATIADTVTVQGVQDPENPPIILFNTDAANAPATRRAGAPANFCYKDLTIQAAGGNNDVVMFTTGAGNVTYDNVTFAKTDATDGGAITWRVYGDSATPKAYDENLRFTNATEDVVFDVTTTFKNGDYTHLEVAAAGTYSGNSDMSKNFNAGGTGKLNKANRVGNGNNAAGCKYSVGLNLVIGEGAQMGEVSAVNWGYGFAYVNVTVKETAASVQNVYGFGPSAIDVYYDFPVSVIVEKPSVVTGKILSYADTCDYSELTAIDPTRIKSTCALQAQTVYTYYVGGNGVDASETPGTKEEPFASVRYLTTNVVKKKAYYPGDTVVIKVTGTALAESSASFSFLGDASNEVYWEIIDSTGKLVPITVEGTGNTPADTVLLWPTGTEPTSTFGLRKYNNLDVTFKNLTMKTEGAGEYVRISAHTGHITFDNVVFSNEGFPTSVSDPTANTSYGGCLGWYVEATATHNRPVSTTAKNHGGTAESPVTVPASVTFKNGDYTSLACVAAASSTVKNDVNGAPEAVLVPTLNIGENAVMGTVYGAKFSHFAPKVYVNVADSATATVQTFGNEGSYKCDVIVDYKGLVSENGVYQHRTYTYYVSQSGTDSSSTTPDGSKNNPLASVKCAILNAIARNGVTQTHPDTGDQKVYYPGDKIVIKVSGTAWAEAIEKANTNSLFVESYNDSYSTLVDFAGTRVPIIIEGTGATAADTTLKFYTSATADYSVHKYNTLDLTFQNLTMKPEGDRAYYIITAATGSVTFDNVVFSNDGFAAAEPGALSGWNLSAGTSNHIHLNTPYVTYQGATPENPAAVNGTMTFKNGDYHSISCVAASGVYLSGNTIFGSSVRVHSKLVISDGAKMGTVYNSYLNTNSTTSTLVVEDDPATPATTVIDRLMGQPDYQKPEGADSGYATSNNAAFAGKLITEIRGGTVTSFTGIGSYNGVTTAGEVSFTVSGGVIGNSEEILSFMGNQSRVKGNFSINISGGTLRGSSIYGTHPFAFVENGTMSVDVSGGEFFGHFFCTADRAVRVSTQNVVVSGGTFHNRFTAVGLPATDGFLPKITVLITGGHFIGLNASGVGETSFRGIQNTHSTYRIGSYSCEIRGGVFEENVFFAGRAPVQTVKKLLVTGGTFRGKLYDLSTTSHSVTVEDVTTTYTYLPAGTAVQIQPTNELSFEGGGIEIRTADALLQWHVTAKPTYLASGAMIEVDRVVGTGTILLEEKSAWFSGIRAFSIPKTNDVSLSVTSQVGDGAVPFIKEITNADESVVVRAYGPLRTAGAGFVFTNRIDARIYFAQNFNSGDRALFDQMSYTLTMPDGEVIQGKFNDFYGNVQSIGGAKYLYISLPSVAAADFHKDIVYEGFGGETKTFSILSLADTAIELYAETDPEFSETAKAIHDYAVAACILVKAEGDPDHASCSFTSADYLIQTEPAVPTRQIVATSTGVQSEGGITVGFNSASGDKLYRRLLLGDTIQIQYYGQLRLTQGSYDAKLLTISIGGEPISPEKCQFTTVSNSNYNRSFTLTLDAKHMTDYYTLQIYYNGILLYTIKDSIALECQAYREVYATSSPKIATLAEKTLHYIYAVRDYNNALNTAAVLAERRDTVFSAMEDMVNVVWSPTKDFVFDLEGDGDAEESGMADPIHLYADRTYIGLPYTHGSGSLYSFVSLAQANNNGVLEIAATSDLLGGSSTAAGARISNDCADAIYWAWATVATSITFRATDSMTDYYGCLKVGDYITTPGRTHTSEYATKTLTSTTNGEDRMFKAYAQMLKGDAMVHYQSGGGHAVMVEYVTVVYTDGKIDGDLSKIKVYEQGSTRMREPETYKRTDPKYGTVYPMMIDQEYSFRYICKGGYLPVTCLELIDPAPISEFSFTDSIATRDTKQEVAAGYFDCDRRLSLVEITIRDENGTVVQDNTLFALQSEMKRFRLDRLPSDIEQKVTTTKTSNIDVSALTVGKKYTCTYVAQLPDGTSRELKTFSFTA